MLSVGFSFIIPFLFLIGITLTNSILFHKRFEVVLPVGLMECAIILYLTGFINLRIGFFLCVLLSLASVPLLFFFSKKKNYSLRKYFSTDLFWAFLIIYSFVFFLNLSKNFSHWDEFSHWGVMAKELLRLDRYYYLEESPLLRHKDYPPFTTLLQYLWCRLCGEYQERHLYNAGILFSLSLLLSLLSGLTPLNNKEHSVRKRLLSIISISLFVITLSLCHSMGEASFYQTIYTESVMACLFLFGLFVFTFYNENTLFSNFQNILILCSLLLVKQIGIYLFFILLVVYILKSIQQQDFSIFKDKQFIKILSCMLIIPFTLWFLWQRAILIHAPKGQFDSSNFNLENIALYLTGQGDEYQYITSQKYFMALFNEPIINKPFSISFIPLIIILFFLILVIIRFEKNAIIRHKIFLLGFTELLGNILYIFIMLISYLYGFNELEATNLACFNRYMGTILYPNILSIVLLTLYVTYNNYFNNIMLLPYLSVLCFLILIPFHTLTYELRPGLLCENVAEIYEGDCQNIIETTPDDSRILVIRQNDTSTSINIIAYKTLPRKYDDDYFRFGVPYDDEDFYTLDYSLKEFSNLLSNFDYVYISQLDEQFIKRYHTLFNNHLSNNRTYQIRQLDNNSTELIDITK